MKSKRKATSLAIASVMALSFATAGVASLTPVSAEDTETVQGFTYNTADFTVTQDYGAYVDGTVFTYPSGAGVVAGGEIRKVGSKVRLDAGRNGVLFTSKASGDDVEGKKVSLAKEQTGDFTMDFRVFSKETAVGHAYTEAAKGNKAPNYWENTAVYNDEHNPFQDIRRVDITFTSVSNPEKSFTVYVFGNDTENTWTDCSAVVYVPGAYEGQTSSYVNGYGLCYDGCGYVCYGKSDGSHFKGHRTRLPGTSFTNVSRNTTSMPTSIWFDAENMKVYGKIYTETLNELGAKGATVKEEYRLIRDMTANPYAEAGLDSWGSQTLNPADFAEGYTVDIAVGEMTSNTTALKQPVWTGSWDNSEEGLLNTKADPSPYVRCTSNDFDVNGDGTVDTNYTYDRYANFIIYDINGEALDVKDGWTVENTTLTTVNAGKYNISDGGPFAEPTWSGTDIYNKNLTALAQFGYAPNDILQGLKFTSKVSNNGAVGEGFSLNVDDFTNADGAFAMKIGAEFDVSKSVNKWNAMQSSMNMEKRGLGDYAEAIDQYSDVKEIKITFRSTVDPSKAFNVYMVSRSSQNAAMAIYTEIEGENYINSTMHRGWALNWGAYSYGDSQGTFGSRTVNLYGETDDTYCFPLIKFDPATMGIYGFSGGNVFNYRTLSNPYSDARFENGVSATLNASDFYNNGESTYTVSVSVERMNTKENVGVNSLSYFNGSWSTWSESIYASGSAPTEGWDHTAVIHVYKLYDKTAMADANGVVKGTTVTAEEDFGLNYYLDLPYGASATAMMQMEGQDAVEVNGVYDTAKALWRFTYPVAAKEYDKKVTLTLTEIDGNVLTNGATYTYSLAEYSQAIVDGESYEQSEKDLVNSLLTYTGSTSAYFNSTAVERVTENVVSASDLSAYKASVTGEDANITLKGATLALESKTVIHVYFEADEATAETVTGAVKVDGQENLYVVKKEVVAKDLGVAQTFTIGEYTVTYSAFSYIASCVDTASDSLYNVLQALYHYGTAANGYFNNSNS